MVTQACAQKPSCPSESGITVIRGSFQARPDVDYQLSNFHARLLPKGKAAPLCYERTTVVSKGEIFISSESITKVLSHELEKSNSKIKDFNVRHHIDGATLTGTITKIIPLHFSIAGPVTTDGSSVRLNVKTVKAEGIPIKELLKLVGGEINSLIQVRGIKVLEAGDDYISLSPEAVANLRGHITSVTTSDKGLTLRYGPPRNPTARKP